MDASKYLKFNLKNKITASLIGFIAVILSLIYFIVIPTINEIEDMGKSIEAQREDLENKYIKGQSLRQLTENLAKIEPKLELLDQVFINKNRDLEFITSLEDEANKNQISQKIDLSSPQVIENQNFQKTNLQLLTNGGFVRQLQYLMDLENLNYYINIKILELSPTSEGEKIQTDIQSIPSAPNETNRLNMLINADTYWN